MILIKQDEYLSIPPDGCINLYATLKPTKFAVYVPYLSIRVEQWLLDAVITYFRLGGVASLGLEEYLDRMFG